MIVVRNVARGREFTFIVATLSLVTSLLAACEPLELSCAETATCPPPMLPDGSLDAAVARDAEANDADVTSEPTEQPPGADAKEEPGVDSPGADAPMVDATGDVPLPPLDVLSDVTGVADVASDVICDTTKGRSPANTPCLIDARYGVFVSPLGNDNSGDGTPAAPYKTLAYAMDNAKSGGKRVYVCDDGTGYPDPLAVGTTGDDASLYGGFECSSWSYATTRRARVHPPTGSALVVQGLVAGLILEDFELVSADVAPGASSIAAIVDASANVTLRRVRLAAGKGGNGADGADGGMALGVPDVDAPQRGSAGTCGSSQPPSPGAWLGPSSCSSLGGAGGQATLDGDGTKGFPGDPRVGVIELNLDNGGLNGVNGADGTRGSEGVAGDTGKPNPASGTFNASGYVVAAPGGSGGAGHTGQGGGGGGASNAPAASGCFGATGGAGGMGGCGGPPGSGGASGGASIALLSWMSQVTLDGCDLVASEGGAGGKGGNGSLGNDGKPGAPGGMTSMPDGGGVTIGTAGSGGPGGHGGNGGSAAGGNGGPSHALVSKGTAPIKTIDTMLTPGAGGAKGIGGVLMGAKALDGSVGASTAELIMP
jgi:hypothetical protein